MTRDEHPPQRTQYHRLSPGDPLDHLRLLWWVLVTPQQLKAYRETFGAKDERRVGKWLASTLIWLPLLIPTLALGLDTLPRGADAFPTVFYWGCLLGLVLAWTLTGWVGSIDIADSGADVAPVGTASVVALGAVLAVAFSVAIGAAIGVANALARHTAFAVTACVCIAESVAFVVADVVTGTRGANTGVLGGLAGFVALGVAGFAGLGAAQGVEDLVANLVMVGITVKAAFSVAEGVQASLTIGHPFWTMRAAFGILVLVHVFLVWFSFLGGWRALV
ncbi:MAG: hypothetical protein V3S14_03035 [Anaerolineae bacterium]